MPANMAIAYHPSFDYAAVEVSGDVYIIADDLLAATSEACGWNAPPVVARFKGDVLEGTSFRHPFIDRESRGILADHVTLEQGTGAVHTAPGHGAEDFIVGRQYGIETYCPVDAQGRFFHAEGADGRLPEELIGKTVWQANPVVLEILRQHGALLAERSVEHSYPHCWRCHKPTIFRATEQWFIGMDRNDFRQRAIQAARGVKWLAGLGRGTLRQHGAEPPGLVYLAPARVGRADHRVLLRNVQRADVRHATAAPRGGAVRRTYG
jgi:isoleucyl-tRNA synthetase